MSIGFYYAVAFFLPFVARRKVINELDRINERIYGKEGAPRPRLKHCRWCEYLTNEHEKCSKIGVPGFCKGYEDHWLKDCATADGKPKEVVVNGKTIVEAALKV